MLRSSAPQSAQSPTRLPVAPSYVPRPRLHPHGNKERPRELRLAATDPDGWLFPAATKSGHIEPSSLSKQHAKAAKVSGVARFELYVLRHTCLTHWAKWMDPFTFHRVAGHADMKTTMRYVHPSDADMDEGIVKAREAQSGHTSGHTQQMTDSVELETAGNQ